MPPADFKYDLPSAAPPSVVREDTIEYGFIGTLHGRGLKTLGVNPRRAMEQIASSKNDPGNGYTKTPDGSLGLPSFVIQNSSFDISPRPYQVYAVQQMVKCIEDDAGNGYVWHTTGSGKTLTSSTSSNPSGDCPVQSAMKTPKARPQSLPRQRDLLGYPSRTLATLRDTLLPKLLSGEISPTMSNSQ